MSLLPLDPHWPARALIAEDEPLLAQHLQAELALAWPGLQVVAVVGDGLQAASQTLALQPQVCFFDIRMPGCTGLEAAQALAEDWPEGVPFPQLVFATAYDQYALQAFEAQAVDYLVKPLERQRLRACLQRLQAGLRLRRTGGDEGAAAGVSGPAGVPSGAGAQADAAGAQSLGAGQPHGAPATLDQAVLQLRRLLEQLPAGLGTGAGQAAPAAPPRLTVVQAQVGNLVHLVPVEEVLYFEAADKYVRVVTAEREHLIRLSLRELLPQLDPAQFWQVHRGTVVQARCITQARREDNGRVTLSLRGCPDKVVASRLYAHLFKGL